MSIALSKVTHDTGWYSGRCWPLTPRNPGRRIGLADLSFHGFEGLIDSIDQQLGRLRIRDDEPRVTTLENAVFVPDSIYMTRGRRSDRGGLVDIEGQPIPAAAGRRGPSGAIDVTPEEEIDEVVYLGWIFGQYGHFLLESLARTWILAETDPSTPVVFNANARELTSRQREMLAAFGISSERLRLPERPTLLRRVVVPEPLYELSHWAHERTGEPYREVAARIAERDGGPGTSHQPVYLSRRLLAGRFRQLAGERELEDLLIENGFLIAHPQAMAFEDQVRMFNRHADIFSVDGTAAHNVLFALGQPRLHLLTDGDLQRDYFLTPVVAGADTHLIRCLGSAGRPLPKVSIFRILPQVFEWEPLRAYLDQCGFLSQRRRARLVPRSESTRLAEHAEAWMLTRLHIATRGDEALDP